MAEAGDLLLGDRTRSPEQALVFAIIAQAVSDLFGGQSSDAGTVRREAMAFLTARSGPWALRRREECDCVGVDPDVLRFRVVAILEGKADFQQVHEKFRQGVAEARAMWAEVKPKPAPVTERVKRFSKEELYRLLPDGEFSIAAIAQQTRGTEQAMQTLLAQLGKHGLVDRVGGGLFRKTREPLDPLRLPRIIPKVDPMKAAKDLVFSLLNEPRTWTEIQESLNGRLTESRIRTVLAQGVESGELIRGEKRRFRLRDASPALPQSRVAANSG